MKRFLLPLLVLPFTGCLVMPSAKNTEASAPRTTAKLVGEGNLGANTPWLSVDLTGTLAFRDGNPNTVIRFTDLYGIQRAFSLQFDRTESGDLVYSVNPYGMVTVTKEADQSPLRFSPGGTPLEGQSANFQATLYRELTAEEASHDIRSGASYRQDVLVNGAGLVESRDATESSLVATVKDRVAGKPDFVSFGANVIDRLGGAHWVSFKATRVSRDGWRLGLSSFENTIAQVDYKLGDQFFADIPPERVSFGKYLFEMKFDRGSGKYTAVGSPTYRFRFKNSEPVEVSLDLSNMTSLAGESTAKLTAAP